jgi:hypothetical protein
MNLPRFAAGLLRTWIKLSTCIRMTHRYGAGKKDRDAVVIKAHTIGAMLVRPRTSCAQTSDQGRLTTHTPTQGPGRAGDA